MAATRVGPAGGADLLLVGERGVGEPHLRRHRLLEHLFQRGEGLAGGVATAGGAVELHRAQEVETVGELRPRLRRDGEESGQRDHVARGLAADPELADVLGRAAVFGLRLDVDAEEAPEPVEVVHVGSAQAGGQGLERLVDGNAELLRLLAIELDLHLGITRVERREDVPDLGTLARGLLELAAQLAQALHAQAAAAVLEEEVEAGGGPEAGDGRDVEREDDGLGNARDLREDPAHERPARASLRRAAPPRA